MKRIPLPNPDDFDEPFFFFTNDKNSQILYVSPSIEKVLGYQPHELIGRRYTEFIDSDLPLNQSINEFRDRRFASGEVDQQQQMRVVLNRQGETRVLRVHTYGNTDDHGTVTINHGIAEDVTEAYQKRLKFEAKLTELRQCDSLLSKRERQVLEAVLRGCLNKTIAKELSITERAIERIRVRLKSKFNAESSAELIAKSTELRLLSEIDESEPYSILNPKNGLAQ